MTDTGRNTVFISHRTVDANVADMIKDFLINTGIPNDKIFCSSLPGNDVNERISPEVKRRLKASTINILILSKDYYDSAYCLNEAGVAWYLDEAIAVPIGLPEINPENMIGFLNNDYKLRRLDNDGDISYLYDIAQERLNTEFVKHGIITRETQKLKERYAQYLTTRDNGTTDEGTSQKRTQNLCLELEKLNASSERKPLLTITLGLTKPEDDEKHPEVFQREQLISIEEDGTIRLRLKKLTTMEKEAEYLPIRKLDVPLDLRRYVSNQAINDYNASLPTKEQMEAYLVIYKEYLRLMENGIPITFFVNNIGTAKATDVSVTIEFPDQIRVFDFEEIIETPEPASPIKLENPIEEAYKKAEKEWAGAFALDTYTPRCIGLRTIPDISSYIASPIKANTIFESIEIEDNIVEIEQKHGIVHTKFDYFPGGYIVPLTSGEFEATVTLMCAEYEDPEETTLRFVVEE